MSDYLIHYKNPYYNKEKAKAYNHWYYETYIKKKRQAQKAQAEYKVKKNSERALEVAEEQANARKAAKERAAGGSTEKAEQDTLNAASEFAKSKTPEEKKRVLKDIEELTKKSKKKSGSSGSKKKSGGSSKKKSRSSGSKKTSSGSKKSSGSSSLGRSKKSSAKRSSSSSKSKKTAAKNKAAKSKLNQARTKLKSLLKKVKDEDKMTSKEINNMNLTEIKDAIEEILEEMENDDDED